MAVGPVIRPLAGPHCEVVYLALHEVGFGKIFVAGDRRGVLTR